MNSPIVALCHVVSALCDLGNAQCDQSLNEAKRKVFHSVQRSAVQKDERPFFSHRGQRCFLLLF